VVLNPVENASFVPWVLATLLTIVSKTKSQSIAYLLSGSEHVYWILDIEDEVHSK
jgi:hypothetical protein